MLLGRESLCAELDDGVAAVRRGTGGSVGLVGPAGIGKTSLIDFAAECASGLQILRAVGSPGDALVPYAGLSQLLAPLLPQLSALPAEHAAALHAALSLGPPSDSGVLAVYMATIELLTAAGQESPLVVLVDDCHWFDEESRQALGFVSRRLLRDPVLIVMAFRDEEGTPLPPAGLRCLAVDGLDPGTAEQLLRERGHHFSPELLSWMLDCSAGNPLALCDLPSFAAPAELTMMALASRPVPVGPRLEAAYGRTFRTLSDDTRLATVIAAVLSDNDLRVVERALGSVGLLPSSLGPAEDAGLLEIGRGVVRIRHPLVRSAVIQLARPSVRRSAHRAAAEGLLASTRPRSHESRVWHLAEAAIGVDEDTAVLLDDLGRSAASQAGFAAACSTYERAAELGEESQRVRRLVAAADAAFNAGESARCRQLLELAGQESDDTSGDERALIHLQAQLDTWSRDPATAARQLQQQAQRIGALDPILSIKLSVDATAAAALSGQLHLASELADTVSAITRAVGPAAEPTGDLLVGSVQAMRGDGDLARPLLDRCRAALDQAPPSTELLQPLVYLATSYHFIDAFDIALPLFDRAIRLARERGALGILPFALAHRANSRYRLGEWESAYADASAALQLAEDSGRVVDRPIAMVMLGQIDAARGAAGARDLAQAAIDGARSMGARFVVAQGLSILGLLELGTGHPAAAVAPLEQCGAMAVELGLMELGYLQWAAELVEALVQSGRGDRVAHVLEVMEGATNPGTTLLNRALLARSRALAAVDASWQSGFAEALELHQRSAVRPFEHARTQLYFGERLRRSRRRRDARVQLSRAWETFTKLGASCWAERAGRELAATGGSAQEPVRTRTDLLTPQEFQVAQAAAAGATNRQIAEMLFLSQKTVEFHLSAIYRRLGLASRSDLSTLLDPVATP